MAEPPIPLGQVCRSFPLAQKWLICPSLRVGHQWIECVVRHGQGVVRLTPVTLVRLALELAGPALAAGNWRLLDSDAGPLLLESAWRSLPSLSYLGAVQPAPRLLESAFHVVQELKLMDVQPEALRRAAPGHAKLLDVAHLLESYEHGLRRHRLADHADVLRFAITALRETDEQSTAIAEPSRNESTAAARDSTRYLIPEEIDVRGLEKRLLLALPAESRLRVTHPARQPDAPHTDISLLGWLPDPSAAPHAQEDGSIDFFRAVGEVNEVREVLRRCLAEDARLDEIEVLHSDQATYPALFYAASLCYASAASPDGVPMTFADGLPVSLS